MVEEIPLPDDSRSPTGERLPIPDHLIHFLMGRKRDQGMQVIRHQKEQAQEPAPALVIVFRGIQDDAGRIRRGKRCVPTFLTAEGDKE